MRLGGVLLATVVVVRRAWRRSRRSREASTVPRRSTRHPLLQIVGSHKRQFHLASLLSIFGQILDLVPALLIGWMAVVLITGKSAALVRLGLGSASSQLWFLAGATALVGVLIAALSFLADTLWRKLAQSVQHEWRTKVYAHLQRVKLRHLEAADTSYTLNVKCLLAGISSFAELVDELAEGRVTRRAQDPGGRTYHARTARPPAALTISWRHSAQEIDAAVRASDFGPHPNEFGTVKLWCPTGFVIVRAAEVCAEASTAPAGTVVSTSAAGMRVAPISHDIRLTQLTTLAGAALTPHALGLCPGYRLPELDSAQAETLTRAYREALWHEPYWVEQLSGLVPLELPARERSTAAAGRRMLPVKVPVAYPAEALLAATLAFLDRVTGAAEAGVGLRWHREPVADAQLFASTLPVRVLTAAGNFTAYRAEVGRRVREVAEHGTYTRDLVIRYPRLHDKHWIDQGLPITVELVDDLDLPAVPDPATALLVRTSRDGECRWLIADPVLSGQTGAQLRDAFVTFLHGLDDQASSGSPCSRPASGTCSPPGTTLPVRWPRPACQRCSRRRWRPCRRRWR